MAMNKWVLLFAAILLVLAIYATPTSASSEVELAESDVAPSANLLEVDVDRRRHRGRGRSSAPAAGRSSSRSSSRSSRKSQRRAQKAAGGLSKKAARKQAKASKKQAKRAAKKANKKAIKAAKKAAKAQKKASKAQAKAAAKATKANKKAAKKAAKVAKKAAKKAAKLAKKAAKKAKKSVAARLQDLGRKAFEKAKRMGLTPKQIAAFVKAQMKKAKSRLSPKPASKVQDPLLKKLLRGVKKQTRKSISKLQAALKKKRAGSVSVPIKHHKITIHPRTPRPKKLKLHKPSPTDKNYVKHLENSKKAWLKKIKSLKGEIHAIKSGVKPKKDWPIEYSLLDPPDSSQAALAKELIDDFKPFLKDAKSIKQADLQEGRDNLVVMEKFRNELRNKLDKAKATPLLPDIYRFIE